MVNLLLCGREGERMKIAMQTRCVHCKREQYALSVWQISQGKEACPWCGKMSKSMTVEEYKEAMKP
jgi:uncharacterized CHY-type Zn-finger protein